MIILSKLSRGTLIRVDDIAENMNWEIMNKCESLFDKFNIKPVLGVIPNNQDSELLGFSKEKKFWNKIKNWQEKGWEISMHGYSHNYDSKTLKKDYFKLGGNSEFFGKSFDDQVKTINLGLEIFKKKGIKIRSFFAPNHTYDRNTFKALKKCKINIVIDGYGIQPYTENDIIFIPQLFYRLFTLPFSFQTTQLHLNEWSDKNFKDFEKFVLLNQKKIISFDEMIKNLSDKFFIKVINKILKYCVISIRILRI